MFEVMPPSLEFMRGILGFIGIGCAFMLGTAAAAVRKGTQKPTRIYGWLVRLILCLAAVAIRHPVDTADFTIWGLSAVAFGVAFWDGSREKKQEDLTHTIFPDGEDRQ